MNAVEYLDIKDKVIKAGHADDIDWAEEIKPCRDAESFLTNYIWIICNSGMKYEIAKIIYEKILNAIIEKRDIASVFNHKGKCNAIKKVMANRSSLFSSYLMAEDKLLFLKTLPYIGPITKYHLARDLGLDVCKPDRHLQRIASIYHTTPHELCSRLARETSDRIGTIDITLWWAGKMGLFPDNHSAPHEPCGQEAGDDRP